VVIAPRFGFGHDAGPRLSHLDSVNIAGYVVGANTVRRQFQVTELERDRLKMSKSTIRGALSIAVATTLLSLAPRESFAQG